MNPRSDKFAASDGVTIRLLEERDLGAALTLTEQARWNQTENDWKRLLRLEPRGCFAACQDGRLVGTASTTTYGSGLAWIGMVLVEQDLRRRGIASRLMISVLDMLEERGVATVKLDATPEGRPVYEKLGFVSESTIERWHGIGRPRSNGGCAKREDDFGLEAFSLDRTAFGADREMLVRSLIADSYSAPLVLRDGVGKLRGYALSRRGTTAAYIGPIVTEDYGSAAALVDDKLRQMDGNRVYIDLNARFRMGAKILADRGLTKQRDLIRMRLGQESSAGTSEFVFAIAGPEIG
jgi:GNAT superfamily N-acetyltransferase